MFWKYVLSAVVGYLLGNISTGLIIGKVIGHIDIRSTGSGNAGTTNIMRTLGFLPSLLTLVGDALKAFAAVKLGRLIGGETCGYIGGVAAMLGHIWPVFFGFKGGKGMACALGIILANEWPIALALFVVQVVVVVLTRYMSIASIATSIAYPILVGILHPNNAPYIVSSVIMALLTLFCHRANITRLAQGNENRLDFDKIKKLGRRKNK